eukprot:TRINITY_DN4712_c0_g1_i5.p3 TRINITY_DN4712_c0_g1~~TRINITY_DN4712_c0_g1_i5.p3  ORF type:complete len:117 (+),score=40.19 TRINITY_DN4712_c0_g1_i5:65-415(+)
MCIRDSFRITLELEEEKREHILVMEALKELEDTRKCWRMVGGVLVERTVGEVKPSIQQNIEMIEKTLQTYNENMKKKEKEIIDFELAYGIKGDKAAQAQQKPEIQEKKATTGGVLA